MIRLWGLHSLHSRSRSSKCDVICSTSRLDVPILAFKLITAGNHEDTVEEIPRPPTRGSGGAVRRYVDECLCGPAGLQATAAAAAPRILSATTAPTSGLLACGRGRSACNGAAAAVA